MPIVPLREPMRAGGIAQVIESKHAKFKRGDIINYLCGWQEYVIFEPDGKNLVPPTKLPGHLNPALLLALSLTGLTAYFGLLEVGEPKARETVLVSGAAGATGSIVGQIAKLEGCRVIGIAGGRVGVLCPKGVAVYFDNVGGEILDEVLLHAALHARIVLCGARSQYNVADDERYVIKNYTSLIIIDYLDHALEGLLCLNRRVDDGKIIQEIDMQHGFDQIPSTLTRLFTGANLGKQLLKVLAAPLPLRTSSIEKTVFKIMSAYAGWRNG